MLEAKPAHGLKTSLFGQAQSLGFRAPHLEAHCGYLENPRPLSSWDSCSILKDHLTPLNSERKPYPKGSKESYFKGFWAPRLYYRRLLGFGLQDYGKHDFGVQRLHYKRLWGEFEP